MTAGWRPISTPVHPPDLAQIDVTKTQRTRRAIKGRSGFMLSNTPKRAPMKGVQKLPSTSSPVPGRTSQPNSSSLAPPSAASMTPGIENGPYEEKFRIFIAIPLPAEVHRNLSSILTSLREKLPNARFVRADQTHVTLKFYGDVRERNIAELIAALRREIVKIPKFSFDIQGAGAFPSPQKARVLWLGVTALNQSLGDLALAVERGSAAAGFSSEAREFRAHLTLARPRGRDEIIRGVAEALVPLQNLRIGPIFVDKIILYRSVLNKSGSVYTPLSIFPLV